MALRYRTARRVGRLATTGRISARQGQYLGRRVLTRTLRGGGRAGGGGAGPGRPAGPAAEERRVITNYSNPVVQDGRRVN